MTVESLGGTLPAVRKNNCPYPCDHDGMWFRANVQPNLTEQTHHFNVAPDDEMCAPDNCG